jgi:tRNA-Thr(GGU) m(6)t(6)A37 methyltransferase TsaA
MASEMKLRPIGVVHNGITDNRHHGWRDVISEIVVAEPLTEALEGLEECSHLIVLYWMHRLSADRGRALTVHPGGHPELPLVGRFATRSPHRPNPIGQATVALLGRSSNVLTVKGLDAIEGTPVLDIKPYMPKYDAALDARVPIWLTKL